MPLRVAIAGVGNCANALVQGVTFYADADERLADAARNGMSVLLLSSDTDEVVAVADRAIVFADGRPKVELSHAELSPGRIARECYTA